MPEFPAPPPPPRAPDRRRHLALLAGGGLVALGSLLPWATVTSGFGSASVAGTSGDGVITLLLGAVAALVAALSWIEDRGLALSGILGAAAGIVGLYDLVNISKVAGEVSTGFVQASAGIGLWLVVLGGAASAASFALKSPRHAASPPTPKG